jgi:hypothetical protein
MEVHVAERHIMEYNHGRMELRGKCGVEMAAWPSRSAVKDLSESR